MSNAAYEAEFNAWKERVSAFFSTSFLHTRQRIDTMASDAERLAYLHAENDRLIRALDNRAPKRAMARILNARDDTVDFAYRLHVTLCCTLESVAARLLGLRNLQAEFNACRDLHVTALVQRPRERPPRRV